MKKTNISLGAVTANDKDRFYKWRNDPVIYKWCRQTDVISKSHHDNYWYLTDSASDRRFWGIRDESEYGHTTVGCAGLTDIDYINSRAEFSLYIGPEFQGRGFGKAALIQLFNKGFNQLNMNLIWGECFDGNPALKLFLDLGMIQEGTRRGFYFKDGKYIDAHLVSIKADEWKFLES